MLLKLKTKATPCRAKFFFWEHFKCAEVNSTLSKRNGNLSKLEWNLAICSSKLPTCLRKLPIQNWPQHYKVARKRASCLTGILLHKRPLQCPLLVPCNFGTWAPLWQVFSTQGHPLIHLVSHNFGIWVSPLEQAWVIYSYMAIPGTTWSVFPWEGGGLLLAPQFLCLTFQCHQSFANYLLVFVIDVIINSSRWRNNGAPSYGHPFNTATLLSAQFFLAFKNAWSLFIQRQAVPCRRVTYYTEQPWMREVFIHFFINSCKPFIWEITKLAIGAG